MYLLYALPGSVYTSLGEEEDNVQAFRLLTNFVSIITDLRFES